MLISKFKEDYSVFQVKLLSGTRYHNKTTLMNKTRVNYIINVDLRTRIFPHKHQFVI